MDVDAPAEGLWPRLRTRLLRETWALPVDLFRILAGLLLLTYFTSLFWQVPEFSSQEGLIEHALVQRLFWFTRLGLFHAELPLPDGVFYFLYAVGVAGSAAIAVGWRIRACAAALFVIAVSAYRWNFIVMYVDDSIMHLLLFWLLLLPVGRTLVLAEWWREGRAVWPRWLEEKVPGTTVWCLLGNLALLYLVAGLWKLESPLWRNGFALYASMRLPIAYFPDFWGPQHLPLLAVLTHASLFVEVVIPFLLVLRPHHPLKWLGLAMMIGFHAGIVATMRIPFANIACIAAGVLWFRDEIMEWLRRRPVRAELHARPAFDRAGRIALAFLLVMCVAQTRRIQILGNTYQPAFGLLWFVGIAQDYQLFNWIHTKNWRGEHAVWVVPADGRPPERLEPERFFPTSLRAVLLQSYLHNVRWIKIPDDQRPKLKRAILRRFTRRFCRRHPTDGTVSVLSRVVQIVPDDPELRGGETRFLVEFECRDGEALICRTMLDHRRNRECRGEAMSHER